MSQDSFSRRRLLQGMALLTTGAFLNGCVRRIPAGGLPAANPSDPLTIDVHCHFFNGTDLQMEKFIEHVQNAAGDHPGQADLAPFAQALTWNVAPTAKSEMKALRAGSQNAVQQRQKARTDSYKKFQRQLNKPRVAEALKSASGSSPASVPAKARDLAASKSYSEYAAAKSNGGIAAALGEYFQYRYVALEDYLSFYNQGTGRTIDLVIAHLVDYDWPLNGGNPPRTPLDDQVKVMERISVLSEGRVHTFAPFDPFREIAFKAGFRNAKWSSLGAVKSWVNDHGCIGVKIYPPMGFAPFGNEQIDPNYWKGVYPWLHDTKRVPDGQGGYATIGQRLDAVLSELYSWCFANDVPIMSHSQLSNGLNMCFDQFPEAHYWKALYRHPQFSRLRLNLGHMGGLEDTSAEDWSVPANPEKKVNACELVALMSADAAAPGGRFYGDTGYNQLILTNQPEMQKLYEAALKWTAPGQAQPLLPDRLMYGSDWSLLMLENDMQKYFGDFVSMYAQLDKDLPPAAKTLSQRFFSDNAVNYLGLRDGRNRSRLLAFYSSRRVAFRDKRTQPIWMDKISP